MFLQRHTFYNVVFCGLGLLCSAEAMARDIFVDASLPQCDGQKGGDEAYFCTIQAGIDAAFADGGAEVEVAPGVYRENIVLREEVSVRGREPGVIIEFPGGPLPPALVVTANESGLRGVTLRLPPGANAPIPLILISGVEEVEIDGVVLEGGFNRDSVGVYVQNQLLETSRIRESEFRNLEVGVIAEDAGFGITRCLFADILRDGIYVRLPLGKGIARNKGESEFDAPEVGDEDDLELSGFNRFRNIGGFADDGGNPINPGDAFLLRNTTGTVLTAQINDWGIYESADIGDRISDQEPGAKGMAPKATATVIFEPYIGKSIFPGSVFVRIRDAVSLLPLENATPELLLNAANTGIAPAFDTVSKLYSFTFVNPNTYTVLALAPAHLSASRSALVGAGEIVALDMAVTPDGSEGEGETTIHAVDTNSNDKVDLTELLRVIQFYNSGAFHCEVGTEDGYAVFAGAQDCTPNTADYAPQDWRISLSELLRVIQFYNSKGLYPCTSSEDGFCPGTPPASI